MHKRARASIVLLAMLLLIPQVEARNGSSAGGRKTDYQPVGQSGVLAGRNSAELFYLKALGFGADGKWVLCAAGLQQAADAYGSSPAEKIGGETTTSLYVRSANMLRIKGAMAKYLPLSRRYWQALIAPLQRLKNIEPAEAKWHWWLAHALLLKGRPNAVTIKAVLAELDACAASTTGPERYRQEARTQAKLVSGLAHSEMRKMALAKEQIAALQKLVPLEPTDVPEKERHAYNNRNFAAAAQAYEQGDWAATQRLLQGLQTDGDVRKYF